MKDVLFAPENGLVILDIDGTVFKTEVEVAKITRDLAAAMGADLPLQYVFAKFSGQRSADKFKGIAHDSKRSKPFTEKELKELSHQHGIQKEAIYGRDVIPVMEGIPKALLEIAEAQYRICAGSTNPSERTGMGLTKMNLIRHFGAGVFGPDSTDDPKAKDKTKIFLKAAEHNKVQIHNAVVIGDTLVDIEGAHAAGAIPVGFLDPLYGNGDIACRKAHEFRAAGAQAVIRSFDNVVVDIAVARMRHRARERSDQIDFQLSA